jgi:hypothetical protein
MQDLSIATLSTILVLLQPAYTLNGSLRLGQLGLSLLGVVGCLGGLIMVLYYLFRAEGYEPGQAHTLHRKASWEG